MFQGLLGFTKAAMWVGLGGAVGAICRAATYLAFDRAQIQLPWGTLLVNVVGSAAIGYFFGAQWDKGAWGEELRLLVTVGFLGALTTFSTFSKEAMQMMQAGQWNWALAHVLGNNLACFAATFVGWRLSSS